MTGHGIVTDPLAPAEPQDRTRSIAGQLMDRALWRARHVLLGDAPIRPVGRDGPVSVAGLFRTASGIGQAARACADGLERSSVPVHRIDLSGVFEQTDLPPDPRLTTKLPPSGTVIIAMNPPELDRALFKLGLWRGHRRRLIGYWVWEFASMPASWLSAATRLTEIWVPSEFCRQAVGDAGGRRITIVPHYVAPAETGESSRKGDAQTFTCVSFADGRSSFERKNLLGSVSAFRRAQLDKAARLIVKTRNLDLFPDYRDQLHRQAAEDPRVTIIDGTIAWARLADILDSADVLLSLHRSEGFGLTIAEAMLRGKVVVATGYSGNTDFMDETCAVPVPYHLVPVEDPSGVYRHAAGLAWAEVDLDFAASALERLASDAALRMRLGRAARARIEPLTKGEQYLRALAQS